MSLHRSAVSATRHVTPSSMQQQGDKLAQDMEKLRTFLRNRIVSGGALLLYAPTTGSSQATGTGNTVFNINYLGSIVIVDGHIGEILAAADLHIHTGSFLTGFVDTFSCVAAVLAYWSGTAIAVTSAKGTPALTASVQSPTIAQCQAAADAASALGTGLTKWIKLGETTLNRTGDTTVTQSYNNVARAELCATEDTDFGDWSSVASF